MADSADVPSVGKNAGAKSAMVTAKASVDAVHDMKKNVSREIKKGSVHRASMPSITLNEVAHPADMFFGATSPVAVSYTHLESDSFWPLNSTGLTAVVIFMRTNGSAMALRPSIR